MVINQIVNGKREGYWERYRRDTGQLWYKCNYIDDNINGYYEEYYSNGKLWCKGNCIDSERDGYWEYYHPNEQLMYKCEFTIGKKHRYSERYNNKGQLEQQQIWL